LIAQRFLQWEATRIVPAATTRMPLSPTIVRKSRSAIGNTACGAAALHDFSQKFMAGLARRTPFSKGCMVDTVHSQAFTA
jgi:hypothetical protein